jgi:hypothetical protein
LKLWVFSFVGRSEFAGINLNPYQGLKLSRAASVWFQLKLIAGINLNPYQGLKLIFRPYSEAMDMAGINLNPYQGLKPRHCHQSDGRVSDA